MHDLIYGTQYQWSALAGGPQSGNPDKHFKSIARQIPGLDAAKFDSCVDSRSMMAKVQAHLKIATERGIRSTPTFQIGNKQFNLNQGDPVSQVSQVLDAELAAATSTPAPTKTTKQP